MKELYEPKATEAFTMGGQTYTTTLNYDVAGQLTGYTYPDGSLVARTYTARGQLHQLKFDGATIDTRVYDNGGRMTSSTYSNGVAEARTYNNDNTLASIAFSGAAIGTYSYGWDDNKNKTSETISGVMSGYGFAVGSSGYDEEDRLLNWERTDSNLDQSWDLSLVGDWDSFTENSSTQNRTHGPTHELLTAGGQSLTHDTKGNMTLIPSGLRSNASSLALTWDFENKMTTADIGNNSSVDVTYKWDALGRRVYRDDGTSAFVYVQVGQQTIADYGWSVAPASPKYNYVYASYIDEPVMREEPSANERLFFHRSQQFSTVALTTSSAAIAERYTYTAYGDPTVCNASGTVIGSSVEDNRITYTGREWDDELVLYHFRARLYDAGVGRFCSRDPIGFASGPNAYATTFYITYVDPLGFDTIAVGETPGQVEIRPTGAEPSCDEGWESAGSSLDTSPASTTNGSSEVVGNQAFVYRSAQVTNWKMIGASAPTACGDPISFTVRVRKWHEENSATELTGGITVTIPFKKIQVEISGGGSYSWGTETGEETSLSHSYGPIKIPCHQVKILHFVEETTFRMVGWRARLNSTDWTKFYDTTMTWPTGRTGYIKCKKKCECC